MISLSSNTKFFTSIVAFLTHQRAERLSRKKKYHRAFRMFAWSAANGVVPAIRQVGECYMTGKGVLKNGREAALWFERAATRGDVIAKTRLASLLLHGVKPGNASSEAVFAENHQEEPNYAEALRWARSAAEDGNVQAQTIAGFILFTGPGEIQDHTEALRWYGCAANQGSAQGYLGMGILKLHISRDPESILAAVQHIELAAKENLDTAHYYMGMIYEKGVGLSVNLMKSAEHYNRAAERGHVKAQAKFGNMLFKGVGTRANKVMGEYWLRRAAIAGDIEAAISVAQIYLHESAEPINYIEAVRWLQKAAEAGDNGSARHLGKLYERGQGVPLDLHEAETWFRMAGQRGDKTAQVELALLLRKPGFKPDDFSCGLVAEWFRQSAETGDCADAFNYAIWHMHGIGTPANPLRAAFWMRKAANQHVSAQFWYGCMLLSGHGVLQNFEKARYWLQRAADAGYVGAKLKLQDLNSFGDRSPADPGVTRTREKTSDKPRNASAIDELRDIDQIGREVTTDQSCGLSWYRDGTNNVEPTTSHILSPVLQVGVTTTLGPTTAQRHVTQVE